MPRWGLIDRPATPLLERESRLERWAGAAPGLLFLLFGLLLLAAVAELFRYGILLYNRARLVSQTTLVVSDALVVFAEVASIVIGIASAAAAVCWLVSRRRALFERAGTREPRSTRSIFLGSLLPIVSLAMPGVYLAELIDARAGSDRPRVLTLVRVWWAAWVVNWALVLGSILLRFRDSLQAQADGVLFSAIVALFAAAVALLTVRVIRTVDDQRWRGSQKRAPTRWVVSVNKKPVVSETAVVNETAVVDKQPEEEKVAAS